MADQPVLQTVPSTADVLAKLKTGTDFARQHTDGWWHVVYLAPDVLTVVQVRATAHVKLYQMASRMCFSSCANAQAYGVELATKSGFTYQTVPDPAAAGNNFLD